MQNSPLTKEFLAVEYIMITVDMVKRIIFRDKNVKAITFSVTKNIIILCHDTCFIFCDRFSCYNVHYVS